MNFKTLLEKIEAGNYSQANYQLVVICHLSSSANFRDTKKSICEKLVNSNKAMKKETSFFMSCPVWKVLTNKGIISKISEGYKLNAKLTNTEKSKILKVCKKTLGDLN